MTQLKLSEKIGKKLKCLIKVSKFRTQEKFAYAMNVDPVTVRRWIAYGIKDIDTINEICMLLEINFKELLE